jgi:ABC-2 type transport system permease protein
MRALLAGELIKVRTTRTALGFGAAATLIVVAIVLLSTLASDPREVADKREVFAFGGAIALLMLFYGAVGATGEFRHRTLAPSVLIAPDRLRLVAARIGAYALTALVFGLVLTAVMLAVGLPLVAGEAGPDPTFADFAGVVGGGLLVVVLAAALGVGFGTLVRNQVGAVIGLVVWSIILEPLVAALSDDLYGYLLGPAMEALALGGSEDTSMLSALLVMLAWTAVTCAAGALVERRRDVV